MKKKVGLLFVILGCLTGCTVTYDLEIYDNRYTEAVVFKMKNDAEEEDIIKELDDMPLYFNDSGEKDKSYKKDVLKKNKKTFEVKYEYVTYDREEYLKSNFIKPCFDSYNIFSDNNKYSLLTSKGFKCINYNYTNTGDIVVNIKTNHVVTKNNADKVSKDTYTWIFTEANASDKNIELEYAKDEYVFNYDNRIQKIIMIVGVSVVSISILGFVIYKIAIKKMQRTNKI